LKGSELPEHFRAVYQGQLSNSETALAKVRQVLDAGLKPIIVAVHVTPERALLNTLRRFENVGRGASIGVMVTIQAGLPDSLQIVRERFGDKVTLQIMDRRVFHEPKELEGWQYLPLLRSEGSHEHIKQRLHQALESHYTEGRIGESAYRQSLGQVHGPENQGMDSSVGEGNEGARHERGGAPENRQENLLTATPATTDAGLGSATAGEPSPPKTSGTLIDPGLAVPGVRVRQ
jgi:hypothetical protein